MNSCRNCLLNLDLNPPLPNGGCPNCGVKPLDFKTEKFAAAAPEAEILSSPNTKGIPVFSSFFKITKQLIFNPTIFFQENNQSILSEDGLSSALSYAIVIIWLSAFSNFIWKSLAAIALRSRISDLLQISSDIFDTPFGTNSMQAFEGTFGAFREKIVSLFFGAGAMVLTPFTALLKLVFLALFIHIAVKLFFKSIVDAPQRYGTTLKILSFASAPWIFCIIPGFGILIAMILEFCIAVIGLREVYKTTTTRATIAVLFPEILVLFFFFAILAFFLIVFLGLFRLAF